jgi:hypothetical protein
VTRYERYLLVSMVLACLGEGALRKWLLPVELQPVAYFSKDVLAALFVLNRISKTGSNELLRLQTRAWLIGIVLIPAALIGLNGSGLGIVLTLKNALLWPLVCVCLASCIDSTTIEKISPYICAFTILSLALGSAQALSTPGAAANAYAWDSYGVSEKATFGNSNLVRASGTFSYLSGLAHFAAVSFLFCLWRFFVTRNRINRWICAMGSLAAIGCALTTGSRTPLGYAGLGLVCGAAVSGRIKALIQIVPLICLGYVGSALLFDQSIITAYVERIQTAGDDIGTRIIGEGFGVVELLSEVPLGNGLGTSSQATNFKAGQMTTAEDARMRLVSEAGLLGVVVLILSVSLIVYLAKKAIILRGSPARTGAAVIGLPALYAVSAGLWFDHVATCLWWILIGLWASSLYNNQRTSTTSVKRQIVRSGAMVMVHGSSGSGA